MSPLKVTGDILSQSADIVYRRDIMNAARRKKATQTRKEKHREREVRINGDLGQHSSRSVDENEL